VKTSLIIFSFIVTSFIFSGCQEPTLDSGETKFKKLSAYNLSDFNFAKHVQYLEIIEYTSNLRQQSRQVKKFAKKVDKRFPVVSKQYYHKGKNSLSQTQKRSLQMLRHEMFIGSDHLAGDSNYGMMRAFVDSRIVQYIDGDGKSHIISTKKELKAVLGKINTPAEVQLWLLLSGDVAGYSYEKVNDDYRVRWNYIQFTDMAGLCYHYTFFRVLDEKGSMGKTFNFKTDLGQCLKMKKRVGD